MLDLMERGIVIHHGSIPLKARLLIEDFVNQGFAKICFATSTLIQGINMPFDAVWIDNFTFRGDEDSKTLGMKNLIGRAGRITQDKEVFDFGYVVVNEQNRSTFSKRLTSINRLSENSALDRDISDIPENLKDIAEATKNNTFDIDLNLTEKQIERIKEANINDDIKFILDAFMDGNSIIKESVYRQLSKSDRDKAKQSFQHVFLSHLRKEELSSREKSILSVAISIMLWRVQGKSFKEIISLRYSYLAQKDEQRKIDAQLRNGEITADDAYRLKRHLKIKYSQEADVLPGTSTGTNVLFNTNQSVLDLDYDKLVYDTYDYLDKVIGQCLIDPITGALKIFYEQTRDERAKALSNYIKYGTNKDKEIWLMRYGFDPENIEWIIDFIISIDAQEITFSDDIIQLPPEKYAVIEKFVYQ